jgi:hypothetical protein
VVEATSPPIIMSPPRRYFWQRRRFWVWSVALFVAAVVAFVALLPSTRALVQFLRIRKGMTEQELISLLGPPTNGYESKISHPIRGNQFRGWVVGELTFTVYLQDGFVVQKSVHTFLTVPKRLLPNLFSRNLL